MSQQLKEKAKRFAGKPRIVGQAEVAAVKAAVAEVAGQVEAVLARRAYQVETLETDKAKLQAGLDWSCNELAEEKAKSSKAKVAPRRGSAPTTANATGGGMATRLRSAAAKRGSQR